MGAAVGGRSGGREGRLVNPADEGRSALRGRRGDTAALGASVPSVEIKHQANLLQQPYVSSELTGASLPS